MDDFFSRLQIREFFWNYPQLLLNLVRLTNPLLTILIALVLGYFSFFFLISSSVETFVKDKDRDKVVEGTVGGLTSTNPMYLTDNQVNRDFYSMVYDRFVDIDSEGKPVANIAEDWEQISELEYVFELSDDFFWHDGSKLTVEDVVWNFEASILLAKNYGEETYGSALEGVEIEKLGEKEIKFTLEEPNATFWEAISEYMIPKHVYEGYSLENFSRTKGLRRAIGSDYYAVESIASDRFRLFAIDEDVDIRGYEYLFFEDYDELSLAIRNNKLDIVSNVNIYEMEYLEEYPFLDIESSVLYRRNKMIYFNNRRSDFEEGEVRQAVSRLIDKESLLEESSVYGKKSYGPLPVNSWAFNDELEEQNYDPDEAQELLEPFGYEREGHYYTTEDGKILALELKYLATDINDRLVHVLQDLLEEEGVLLNLESLSYDELMREVLPRRDFDLLLNEIETTVDPDQYNLWHSMRIDNPHLNISGYEYSRVDILLENARTELDRAERKEDYNLFQRYVVDDAPAIFLYHPKKFFIINENLSGYDLGEIITPCDRFQNVEDWYWN